MTRKWRQSSQEDTSQFGRRQQRMESRPRLDTPIRTLDAVVCGKAWAIFFNGRGESVTLDILRNPMMPLIPLLQRALKPKNRRPKIETVPPDHCSDLDHAWPEESVPFSRIALYMEPVHLQGAVDTLRQHDQGGYHYAFSTQTRASFLSFFGCWSSGSTPTTQQQLARHPPRSHAPPLPLQIRDQGDSRPRLSESALHRHASSSRPASVAVVPTPPATLTLVGD